MGRCCRDAIETTSRHIADTECPTFIAPLGFAPNDLREP